MSLPNHYSNKNHSLTIPPDSSKKRSGSPYPGSKSRSPLHPGVENRRRHSDLSLLQKMLAQPSGGSEKSRLLQGSPKSHRLPLSLSSSPEARSSSFPHENPPNHGIWFKTSIHLQFFFSAMRPRFFVFGPHLFNLPDRSCMTALKLWRHWILLDLRWHRYDVLSSEAAQLASHSAPVRFCDFHTLHGEGGLLESSLPRPQWSQRIHA